MKRIRNAAMRTGADAVLVMDATEESDSGINPLAVFNITLIGAYILPGSTSKTVTLLEGLLMDTRNGYIYAVGSSEGDHTTIGPTLIMEYDASAKGARKEAIQSFGEDLLRRMEKRLENTDESSEPDSNNSNDKEEGQK